MNGYITKRVKIAKLEMNQPSNAQTNKSGLAPTVGTKSVYYDLYTARVYPSK